MTGTPLLRGLGLASVLALAACGEGASTAPTGDPSAPAAPVEVVTIRLSTTTSTRDSGLLDRILPMAEKEIGVRAEVIAVGTGQALRMGKDGDADLLMTHDPKGEKDLVEAGFVVERREFMFNDFVIVGSAKDPAGVKGTREAKAAFAKIADAKAPWVSRGDDSGTHRMEKRLWKAAEVDPKGAWYSETGQGMGPTLAMAFEKGAYTLTDRSTWLAHKDAGDLPILVEGDEVFRNVYSVMIVNPGKHPHAKADAARRLAAWLTGPSGRKAIGEFTIQGKQVFFLLPGE
jgi:tungstate transport system substrate-binding protein